MQAHHLPLCAACQFEKQRQRPSPGKRSSVVKDVEGNLKKEMPYLDNALLWITTSAPQRKDVLLQEGKPRILACIQEEHSWWT